MALSIFGRLKDVIMVSDVEGIKERFKSAGIGLKDALAVIEMTLEDQLEEDVALSPYEVFGGLNEVIDRTVRGTRVERFGPQGRGQPFHTFEIHTEEGEVLGYLNMIYFSKPIRCYYLVYVEVLPSFRRRGLGNKILKSFREFVRNKDAVGLLDNIIPPEEPTYEIYTKLGWKSVGELIDNGVANGGGNYMVFVPTSVKTPDLRDKLVKLLFNLRKKRPVIDMRDNEAMVKRTIEEFRSVHEALERLFANELSTGTTTPLMRFMFTKFVTKLLGFRRRIALLLGYTGGESLEQISISDMMKAMPIQPYSLWGREGERAEIQAEEGFIRDLPDGLKEAPTLFIEGLPLYGRPYLSSWMERKEGIGSLDLEISDLLELGFDPTRLREFHHEGEDHIFERLSPRFLPAIEKKRRYLPEISTSARGRRFRDAVVQINPPLAIIRDRGNVYILRKKVEGIHSEEALDQLRTSPYLREMNSSVRIDRVVVKTINEIKTWLLTGVGPNLREEVEELTFFVPWDLGKNVPRICVDPSGVSLDCIWIA